MSPDQAEAMAEFFFSVIDQEMPTTQRVIRSIPEDQRGYRPHPASRSALELAAHLATGDLWFLDSLATGSFGDYSEDKERAISSIAAAAELYESQWPAGIAAVKRLSGEQLAKEMAFPGGLNLPTVIYLSFLIRHQVHHRGQLTTYLRPMGAKVPSIYGGSADEPFQPPSE